MTADKLLVMKRFQIVATFVAISKIVNTRENSRRFYLDCNNLYIDKKNCIPGLFLKIAAMNVLSMLDFSIILLD